MNALTVKKGFGFPISEKVEDIQLGDANFGPDGGTASVTFLMNLNGDFKSLLLNLRSILGWHIAPGARMVRTNPKLHPLFPNLWAQRVSGCKGVKFLGPLETGWGIAANFQLVEVTIQYSTVQYMILSDGDMAQPGRGEWSRYVIKRSRPRLEYLATDNPPGFRFFPVAPPAFQPGGVADANNVIKTSIARPVCSELVEWEWVLVPVAYVCDQDGFAKNIKACIGKVNDDVFPPGGQYPAGTLLLEEPHIEPMPSPFPPENPLGPGSGWGPGSGYVTVKLPFRYFDPPPVAGMDAYPAWQRQGHNLYAHPSDPNYWYRISCRLPVAAPTDTPRFGSASYAKIFQHV